RRDARGRGREAVHDPVRWRVSDAARARRRTRVHRSERRSRRGRRRAQPAGCPDADRRHRRRDRRRLDRLRRRPAAVCRGNGRELVPRARALVRGDSARPGGGTDDDALPSAPVRRAGDGTLTARDEWADRFGRRDPKIICIGLNYKAHAGESGGEPPKAPLLFGKFANALCGDGDPIVIPAGIGHVDAEAELAVVMGEGGTVYGYTCANDVSARDAQFGDGQWFRGKGFDTFCPVGPRIVDAGDVDPSDLAIRQRLNGETLQDSRTSDLIFDVPALVSYVSSQLTLEPGDLILTGTPEGVGVFREPKISLAGGDVVEIEIEGIGVLRNPVEAR